MDSMALANPGAFFEVIDRFPQVRIILWGHVHQAFRVQRKEVALLASPSTCIQFLPGSDHFGVDRQPPGLRWLELFPDGRFNTGIERLDAYPNPLDLASQGY
jgi:Icc protein